MTVGEIQLQLGLVGHPEHKRADGNRSEDREVKEMIIGVGNGRSQYLYDLG